MSAVALSRSETSARTNIIVEERAGLAWILRAFKMESPNASPERADGRSSSSIVDHSPGSSSSSSSSGDSDQEVEAKPHGAVVTPPPINGARSNSNPPVRNMEDDYQRYAMAQKEWQVFEDRARELRRLVTGEHDPSALKQLQHLKLPKTTRPAKSELPTIMVAHRLRRTDVADAQENSSSEQFTKAQQVLQTREAAARKRRLQSQNEKPSETEPASCERLPPLDSRSKSAAASIGKLPPLPGGAQSTAASQYSPLTPITEQSLPQLHQAGRRDTNRVVDDDAPVVQAAAIATVSTQPLSRATNETNEKDTASLAAKPALLDDDSSEMTNDHAALVDDSRSPQAKNAAGEAQPDHASSEVVRRTAELSKKELRHVEETERLVRSDLVEEEADSHREMEREVIFSQSSIARRERERALAEREQQFQKEMLQTQERKSVVHDEEVDRSSVEAEQLAHHWVFEQRYLELRSLLSRMDIITFESLERRSAMEGEISERSLSQRLAEERRVREEAERRIRLFAERRAREERERAFADKFRLDIQRQMALIASEIDRRHIIGQDENQGYVKLLQRSSEVHEVIGKLREEQLRKEADRRLNEERDALRKKLAAEHSARRDLQMDEDKDRENIKKDSTNVWSELRSQERIERQSAEAATIIRQISLLIITEGRQRETVEADEDTCRNRCEGAERGAMVNVLERVKRRESEEARKAFEEANRVLQDALKAKQEAAEKLRLETEQIEQEREERRRRDALQQLLASQQLLHNQESLHRQLVEASYLADWDTMRNREQAAVDILQNRLEATRQRRIETEQMISERRRRMDEEEASHAEAVKNRREELLRQEEDKFERHTQDREDVVVPSSSSSKPSSPVMEDPQQRFVALQLAQQLAEEEARRKKREDEIAQQLRNLELIRQAVQSMESTETSERSGVSAKEHAARGRLLQIAELNKRSAQDRERLRYLESVQDEDTSDDIQGMESNTTSNLAISESAARLVVAQEEAAESTKLRERFRDATALVVHQHLDRQKESLAAKDHDIAALLANEKERKESERRNALYAALFAVVRSETESRDLLSGTEALVRSKMLDYKEHDMILARASESKRLAEERERRRSEEREREVVEQKNEEILLFFTKQQLSVMKDEVFHRQVIEMAEQADTDNINSRSLHDRVLLETKEAARLRQQQRELEERAVILAKVEVLLQHIQAEEIQKRSSIAVDENALRRHLADSVDSSEVRFRVQEAQRVASEMIRSTPVVSSAPRVAVDTEMNKNVVVVTSSVDPSFGTTTVLSTVPEVASDDTALAPWERVIREKQAALLRATTQALEKKSAPADTARVSTTARTSSPRSSSDAVQYSEEEVRQICSDMDLRILLLFFNEETFLRATVEVSEHSIRRDLAREERHLRRVYLRSLRGSPKQPQSIVGDASEYSSLLSNWTALNAKEGYLRQAILAEEHQGLLVLLSHAQACGIMFAGHDISPLRARTHSVMSPATASPAHRFAAQKWLRASMEVVFQEEYHQREQIIAEYNRVHLSELFAPFERDVAITNLISDEVLTRRQIESEEATVVTKFLKRVKRLFKMAEVLEENSQQSRDLVLREYQARLQLFSRDELWDEWQCLKQSRTLISNSVVPPARDSPVPRLASELYPSQERPEAEEDDGNDGTVTALPKAPFGASLTQFVTPPPSAEQPHRQKTLERNGIQDASPHKVQGLSAEGEQAFPSAPPAGALRDMASVSAPSLHESQSSNRNASSSPVSRPLVPVTAKQLREALVEVEIGQSKKRVELQTAAVSNGRELMRCANHILWLVSFSQSSVTALDELASRQIGFLYEQRSQELQQQTQRRIQRSLDALVVDRNPRNAVESQEQFERQWFYRYHSLVETSDKLLAKETRVRRVLFQSVELEVSSSSRLAAQRHFESLSYYTALDERNGREAIQDEEGQAAKRLKREIVDLMEYREKITVEIIVQRKKLAVEDERTRRSQMEWTYDLMMRLTQRFLKLQQAIEKASAEFSKAKQSWCLDQCLIQQQRTLEVAHQQEMQKGMVFMVLSRQESEQRETLQRLEEYFWRFYLRWDRFSLAVESFSEKCLAAKIALVERMAGPGLPPPPSVLQAKLPRLKSVLQRSASMAFVLNSTMTPNQQAVTPTPLQSDSSFSFQRVNSIVQRAISPPVDMASPSSMGAVPAIAPPSTSASPVLGRGAVSPPPGFMSPNLRVRVSPDESQVSLNDSVGFGAEPSARFALYSSQSSRSFLTTPNQAARNRMSPTASFVDDTVQEALNEMTRFPQELQNLLQMAHANDPALSQLDLTSFASVFTTERSLSTVASLCSKNTNITNVTLSGVPMPSGEDWAEPLARLANSAGSLDLTECSLTDDTVTSLLGKFATADRGGNVRSIILDDNPLLSAQIPSHIARIARMTHSMLERVSLKRVPSITDVHVKWLAFYFDLNKQHKQFKSVVLAVESKQSVPRLNFSIPRSKGSSFNLKGIDALFRREFDDRSVRLLCIAVANNESVESISFKGNRITDKGAKLLATLLQKNRTIKELDLSYNEITNEGASEFEKLLAGGNTTLLHLDLSENKGITDIALMQKLAQRLRRNIDVAPV